MSHGWPMMKPISTVLAIWAVLVLQLFSRLPICAALIVETVVDRRGAIALRDVDQTLNEGRSPPCGTSTSQDEVQRAQDAFRTLSFSATSRNSTSQPQRRQGPLRNYTFDVQWNIVAADFSYEGGWITDSQITAQMELLNRHYEGTGISWNHRGTTRIINRYWFESITSNTTVHITNLMSTFRVGGRETLNVYTVGFSRDTVNAFSSLPVNYDRNPARDGIMMLYNILPGGSHRDRQGSTMTHESGHWLGLAHTFAGGCLGIGDGVDDTPAEAVEAYGCPVGRDTCPGGGPDPIYNFMDYTDESCRREFTPGQVALMHRSIEAFRVPTGDSVFR